MVIGVPWFLLELKHLATPEVMDFCKETSNPLCFHKRLLGTSNSLVWGIDECSNTHHFLSYLNCKTNKNTQKCIKNTKNISGLCFMCFRCNMSENK